MNERFFQVVTITKTWQNTLFKYGCSIKRMQLSRLVFFFLVSLVLVPSVYGAVSSVNVSPLNADTGDTIMVDIVASPDEIVPLRVEFDGYLPVSGGEFKVTFNDIELRSDSNGISATLTDVSNIEFKVKYKFLTYLTQLEASSGVVSVSRSDVPAGEYDITLSGESVPRANRVHLDLDIELSVTMDSQGEFTFRQDTGSIESGVFGINVDGNLFTVNVDEPFLPPPPPSVNPPSSPPDEPSEENLVESFEGASGDELEGILGYNHSVAAGILEELSLEKAVEAVTLFNDTEVLSYVSLNRTVEIVSSVDNGTSGVIMNRLEPERAGEVLLSSGSDGVSIVSSMITDNITDAAVRVEHAVKNRNVESDPVVFGSKTVKLESVFSGFDPSDLVPLLESIALLPETPSTVADVFVIIGLSSSSSLVSSWLEEGNLELLRLVLGFLEPDFSVELYQIVMDPVLFSLLSDEVIRLMPESDSFIITTNLSPVSPSESDSVVFSLLVVNHGELPGHKSVSTSLRGREVIDQWVVLYPGEDLVIEYETTLEPGDYELVYPGGGLSFTVSRVLSPPDIVVSEVDMPRELELGDDLHVSVSLVNNGETGGDVELELLLNDASYSSETVSVDGLSDCVVNSSLSGLSAGLNVVTLNGVSYTVEVVEPSKVPLSPVNVIIGVVVVLFLLRDEKVVLF